MQNPDHPPSPDPKPPRPEQEKPRAINKTNADQLAVQFRFLDGSSHTWSYAHLYSHSLRGGTLIIWFSAHIVQVCGRHLEEADEGLRLHSLVYLQETGTRRKDALGEQEIPEDQPAIDSIRIEDRKED